MLPKKKNVKKLFKILKKFFLIQLKKEDLASEILKILLVKLVIFKKFLKFMIERAKIVSDLNAKE